MEGVHSEKMIMENKYFEHIKKDAIEYCKCIDKSSHTIAMDAFIAGAYSTFKRPVFEHDKIEVAIEDVLNNFWGLDFKALQSSYRGRQLVYLRNSVAYILYCNNWTTVEIAKLLNKHRTYTYRSIKVMEDRAYNAELCYIYNKLLLALHV